MLYWLKKEFKLILAESITSSCFAAKQFAQN